MIAKTLGKKEKPIYHIGVIGLLVIFSLFGLFFIINFFVPVLIRGLAGWLLATFTFLAAVFFSLFGSISFFRHHQKREKVIAWIVLGVGLFAGLVNLFALVLVLSYGFFI